MTTTNLSAKEQALLDSIQEGMDEPGCGWLHELEPFNNDHVAAGVLGALITKGLVTSTEELEPGRPPCYWVQLA
jgi:hypothetical protein